MMESLFHSEKLFQVHILCQRRGTGERWCLCLTLAKAWNEKQGEIIYLNFKSSIFAVSAGDDFIPMATVEVYIPLSRGNRARLFFHKQLAGA